MLKGDNMLRSLFAIIFFASASLNAYAESKETERLAQVTLDYAKCADVALGNFTSDEKAQEAIKVFYKAMIKNVENMLVLESASKNESTEYFLDIMGKDVFVGFMLKGFSEVGPQYKDEKKKLTKELNYDWRLVNERLWSKQGCNAIYGSLSN
ncbi:hypothetical protein A3737_14245 [Oleiphilus sp. HI0065]|nr:hypothetical protein A3737_14245 [Oleiphilus sp. HI0065]KZZ80908.1 hypothetical protein A3767_09260 [Oleiphilus sp. HI0133]